MTAAGNAELWGLRSILRLYTDAACDGLVQTGGESVCVAFPVSSKLLVGVIRKGNASTLCPLGGPALVRADGKLAIRIHTRWPSRAVNAALSGRLARNNGR